jgi:hypothetical protein
MPNPVNDERLYHLIEFEISRNLTKYKLERPEIFTSLALAAGLLAALQYVFGWFFALFYPWFMMQFMIIRMFKIDPSKGLPPRKMTKNDRITNVDKENFVNEAKERLAARNPMPRGFCYMLGMNLQQCLRRCFTCSSTRYGKIIE